MYAEPQGRGCQRASDIGAGSSGAAKGLVVAVRGFIAPVSHVDEWLALDDPLCRTPHQWPSRIVLPQPFDKLFVAPHRDGMQLLAVKAPYVTMSGLAERGLRWRASSQKPPAGRPENWRWPLARQR